MLSREAIFALHALVNIVSMVAGIILIAFVFVAILPANRGEGGDIILSMPACNAVQKMGITVSENYDDGCRLQAYYVLTSFRRRVEISQAISVEVPQEMVLSIKPFNYSAPPSSERENFRRRALITAACAAVVLLVMLALGRWLSHQPK